MTASHSLTASDLIQILAGDVTHIPALEGRQFDITKVVAEMPSACLTLFPDAVKRVLMGLLRREIVPEQAQAWASFVRRGYVSGASAPISPISITYDPKHENDIADTVARLDELGDLIDGTMDDDEIRQLMEHLDR